MARERNDEDVKNPRGDHKDSENAGRQKQEKKIGKGLLNVQNECRSRKSKISRKEEEGQTLIIQKGCLRGVVRKRATGNAARRE